LTSDPAEGTAPIPLVAALKAPAALHKFTGLSRDLVRVMTLLDPRAHY
jgi:hypothetical protein